MQADVSISLVSCPYGSSLALCMAFHGSLSSLNGVLSSILGVSIVTGMTSTEVSLFIHGLMVLLSWVTPRGVIFFGRYGRGILVGSVTVLEKAIVGNIKGCLARVATQMRGGMGFSCRGVTVAVTADSLAFVGIVRITGYIFRMAVVVMATAFQGKGVITLVLAFGCLSFVIMANGGGGVLIDTCCTAQDMGFTTDIVRGKTVKVS